MFFSTIPVCQDFVKVTQNHKIELNEIKQKLGKMQNQRKGKSDCQSNLVPIFRSDVKVSTGNLKIKNIERPYEQFFTTLKFFVFFSS